ncbi:hypothetical protein [Streptomyces sp. MMBL 11-1]|uniref:hypothetical protein n=1 Tax=Streptomyces sp. MMBL 11-1 TaxID=3026420 RepID=UPI0023608905|nr:hypothetical protein [Streptomyces sp. MMBL 11-1]
MAAAEEAAEDLAAAGDPAAAQAAMAAALAAEEEMRERVAEQTAARLPGTTPRNCCAEVALTAYPSGPSGPAHGDVAMIRAVLAGLLARDVALLARRRPAAGVPRRPRRGARGRQRPRNGGPRLARTVLDTG